MSEFYYLGIIAVTYLSLIGASAIGSDALLVLMAMITITGNVIVGKILLISGWQLNPGAGMAVGLFWIGSLLTQFYGVREAKKALWVNFGSLIFLTIIGWLTIHVPGGVVPAMDNSMETIFGFMPGVMLGAITSFGAAYLFNIFIQRRVQKASGGCIHWFPQTILVAIANLIDIAIFTSIAFHGSAGNIGEIILVTWSVRLAAIIIGLPVILLIRQLYMRKIFPILKNQ